MMASTPFFPAVLMFVSFGELVLFDIELYVGVAENCIDKTVAV